MNKRLLKYNYINKIIRKIILKSIRFYQITLSPDKGLLKVFFPYGYCKFSPHCSEYTYQAIEKLGIIKGLRKGLGRIIRCNPFSKGGFDSVK